VDDTYLVGTDRRFKDSSIERVLPKGHLMNLSLASVTTRDVALCSIVALVVVALVVVSFIQPPAAPVIITTLGAIGIGGMGRIGPAPTPAPSAETASAVEPIEPDLAA